MRTRTLTIIGLVGVLTFGFAAPASADFAGDTAAAITVDAGVLSITVPADAGSLGHDASTVLGTTVSGPLGVVQVNDARATSAGWVARRDLHRVHPGVRHRGQLHRRHHHQGRHRDLHRRQPDQPHRRRRGGHRDSGHRRQLRHLEPDHSRRRPRRHGPGLYSAVITHSVA